MLGGAISVLAKELPPAAAGIKVGVEGVPLRGRDASPILQLPIIENLDLIRVSNGRTIKRRISENQKSAE